MPASLTTVTAITKELYEGTLQKQLNDDIKTLKRVERTSEGVTSNVGGKYAVFPIHTRRNSGVGARRERELLPTAGQQGTAAAQVGLKYQYGRIELSGQVIELVKTNAQAFMSALDLEVNGIKNDLRKDGNRQVYGNGSGAIGTVTTLSAGTNSPEVGWTGWFQLGEKVDVIDGTTLGAATPTVVVSNREVTGIDKAASTVTLDGAPFAVAVGDIIVRTGNVNREWIGFDKIIDDTGSVYNIDPSVEPVWKSVVNDNGGANRAISETLMTTMVDDISANGGGVPTVVFQSAGVRRSYSNLLMGLRRFTNTQEFTGGFSGLAFTTDEGDIPLVSDTDCPPNTQYYVNEKEIKLYREGDWSWMNRDGSMWQRVVGYDAYEATMFQYSEIGTHRRNAHGVLKDITEA